ncbi:MAG: YfhO family protein, partial [Lachnospiraceae bacterium]|nr:YfhO family protein [Lachnospiraceae bacterium]
MHHLENETKPRRRKQKRRFSFTFHKIFLPDWESMRMLTLFFAFFIPFIIMFSLFIINRIYPFGDRSFLFSDMYHQYMPFFSEFFDKIKAGEGIDYSFHVGIGSNFLALYVYYLASPLHWLAFLLPKAFLMEFMSYLVIVKISLCGLTSCIYLRRHFHTKEMPTLFFSTFYALSGFMAAYNWNIMWLDCVILLPLVVLGLERLVKDRKCGLYTITLALSIFTNYYISIMLCIFLVLYFLILLCSEGLRGGRSVLLRIFDFALFSLLAAGMAGILLIPEVCAILETDFGNSTFPHKLESYFSALDVLARHCLCITTERGLEHWPNIYCGVAVFLLIPLYVFNQKISLRRRFGFFLLCSLFIFSFATNMADFVWHGFNYPDSLPARQSFIYIFLILVMCYEVFHTLEDIPAKHLQYAYLAAVGFLLFSEKFTENTDFPVAVELLALVFITCYTVLLYLYKTKVLEERDLVQKKHLSIALGIATMLIVVIESGLNMGDTSVGTVSRSAYLNQQADYQTLLDTISDRDGQIYRIEKFDRKTKNDGTLTGYPTASVFSSTLNSRVTNLYERLGMRHSKVFYSFDGATALTGALLNVDYMFGNTKTQENSLYRVKGTSGDIVLFENTATLPLGYSVPYEYDLPDGYDYEPISLQNELVGDLLGTGVGKNHQLFWRVGGSFTEGKMKLDVPESGQYYAL